MYSDTSQGSETVIYETQKLLYSKEYLPPISIFIELYYIC